MTVVRTASPDVAVRRTDASVRERGSGGGGRHRIPLLPPRRPRGPAGFFLLPVRRGSEASLHKRVGGRNHCAASKRRPLPVNPQVRGSSVRGELRGSPRTPNSPRVTRNRREARPPGVSRFPVWAQGFATSRRLSPGSLFRNRNFGHLAEPGAFPHGDRKSGFELSKSLVNSPHGVNRAFSQGRPWCAVSKSCLSSRLDGPAPPGR
jgi:hypothetical protein